MDKFSWAVGFWEGEGSGGVAGADGKFYLSAYQKDRETLEWLVELWGGNIYLSNGCHMWRLHGVKALHVIAEMYPHLSKRRQEQVDGWLALAGRTIRDELPPIGRVIPTHCSKGHELSGDNLRPPGGRRCRKCHNEYQREWNSTNRLLLGDKK